MQKDSVQSSALNLEFQKTSVMTNSWCGLVQNKASLTQIDQNTTKAKPVACNENIIPEYSPCRL